MEIFPDTFLRELVEELSLPDEQAVRLSATATPSAKIAPPGLRIRAMLCLLSGLWWLDLVPLPRCFRRVTRRCAPFLPLSTQTNKTRFVNSLGCVDICRFWGHAARGGRSPRGGSMLAQQRQQAILDLVQPHGGVRVADLVREFSDSTLPLS